MHTVNMTLYYKPQKCLVLKLPLCTIVNKNSGMNTGHIFYSYLLR